MKPKPLSLLELKAKELYGFTPKEAKRLMAMLAPRQRRVVVLKAKGLTCGETGVEMGITPATVLKHLSLARQKTGVPSKLMSALYFASRYDPNCMLAQDDDALVHGPVFASEEPPTLTDDECLPSSGLLY